ncbi:MAG: flagellar hook-basal body complex protein [Desulfovibrio sp.]|nr:flagellar hook-basal body complex protein [Desulfovibrio sp.]
MRSSLYIGATGMKSLSEGLHVTTNNLANCSTIGFKSQMALYSDLIYKEQANPGEWNNNQANSCVAVGQHGMGVSVEEIATNFTQGGFESSNSLTDLAINGKGYFMVQDASGDNFYTRAGDFNVDTEGVVRNPNGLALMGVNLFQQTDALTGQGNAADDTEAQATGDLTNATLEAIEIDRFKHVDAKQTSAVTITDTNLIPNSNVLTDIENPYFSMLQAYDATSSDPLTTNQFSNAQGITIYDESGTAHEVTLYYDGADQNGTNQYVEFLMADTVENAENVGDGLLMSGVLQFDAAGQLTGLAAYTPEQAGSTALSDWTSASLSEDGLPTFKLGEHDVTINFGISSETGTLTTQNSAEAVGTVARNLAFLSGAQTENFAVTGYSSNPFVSASTQDGYAEGVLSSYEISNDGIISGNFSNGENIDLWQIPLARFTSDDGLHRHGDNLFGYTSEAGAMELGVPGSENYGTVCPYYIENSNVDVANEMVHMIVTQRGFQSNSKVVTTSDELLKTAINLKR